MILTENLKFGRLARIDWSLWGILALGFVLRILLLDKRPPHVDEAVNGWFLGQITAKGYYAYNASNYHGPLHYYILFLFKFLFGSTLISLRLSAVCFGTAVLGLICSMGKYFGRPVAYGAALFLAVSPGMVFYSRYAIHESAFLFFSLLCISGILRLYAEGDKTSLWYLGAGISGMVVLKETFLIHLAAMGLSLVTCKSLEATLPTREGFSLARRSFSRQDISKVAAVAIFAVICFYSGFFLHWEGLVDFTKSLVIWTERSLQPKGHAKPFLYWVGIFVRYEWVCAAGLVGIFTLIFSDQRSKRFAALYGGIVLTVYSLIPYKTPWLVIGFIWPFALSVSSCLNELAGRSRRCLRIALIAGTLFVAASLWKTVTLNFFHETDPNEPYVYVQTFTPIMAVKDKLDRLVKSDRTERHMPISVLFKDYWPLPWLLRDFTNVSYATNIPDNIDSQVVFCETAHQGVVESALRRDYFVERFPLRNAREDIAVYLEATTFSGLVSPDMRRVAAATAREIPEGKGLMAWYFGNREWKGPTLFRRRTADLDFHWEDLNRPLPAPFGIILEGEIFIPEDGPRTFLLTSDDGAELVIDGEVVIDNLGVHEELTKMGSKNLSQGWRKIRIRYFDVGGGAILRLYWQDSAGQAVPIPLQNLRVKSTAEQT
ncbi:MAG: TIGR03663 family protein [Candidatus Omnitrophota bacterium]|nr:TIGR03663 family protein [Candidatus Omnitrophota bacterium]